MKSPASAEIQQAGFFSIFETMSQPFISLENVSKHYSEDSAAGVSTIDLVIKKGDFIAIVGESGSGKSTLLKLIYGLLAPDSGEVFFKGEHLNGPHEKLIPGHDSMKMLNQDFNLNLFAKVYENIESMLSNEDVEGKKQKALAMMGFLRIDHLANKKIVELSGGEQQRVALARAIITEPEVLLLDEPFSQLDAVLKTQFRADLKRLNDELGITIIIVSHDPVDGLTLANQMIILKDGKLIESGKPDQLYSKPAYIYTGKLLGNAFVLSSEAARKMGIKTKKESVMIYPEWVQLKSSWSSKGYLIKDVFFRGFYEDLLLERDGIEVIAMNPKPGIYSKGQKVQVVISNFLEF
ncbi:ABC-type Fe3+/spermidine/putrescine transport systems, ATPase components [Daejeonella rubra]|uniref:ABC-type Fe3+/spermidine/putrescine transport systems, ATPase components n=2 Tax=Daejeonella rubra TaxID=990371 RepID=A0A1G9MMP2_9SPHI|nr:ABC-type Fe3+/spermidine/putrescine transport systems, ATPase components [Daejeonella rubra]